MAVQNAAVNPFLLALARQHFAQQAAPVQPLVHPTAAPTTPPAPKVNPYTGQPLAPNEYVGPAGSEATHPGMVRIPPPGWWDPSNPNYERRSYYIAPNGTIVAREPGYYDANHPFDTGRVGEANTEDERRSGYTSVIMSQPGVEQRGPGSTAPKSQPGAPYAAQAAASGGPAAAPAILGVRPSGASIDPAAVLAAVAPAGLSGLQGVPLPVAAALGTGRRAPRIKLAKPHAARPSFPVLVGIAKYGRKRGNAYA